MKMNRATALIGLFLISIPSAVVTGCGTLIPTSTAAQTQRCIVQVSAPASVVVALVDRDERDAQAQVKAMLLTAPPNAYIIIRELDTGNRLGTFKTPTGISLPGPALPAPLPTDPTQVQLYAYDKAITKYDAALRRDQAMVHHQWLSRLSAWAGRVTAETATAPESGMQQISEVSGFRRALTAAAADISSLKHIPGIQLGTRIVAVVIDLDMVSTNSVPPLPNGLRAVTVAVTGFPGTSRAQGAWSQQFTHDGARQAMFMTPATSNELPAVLEPVLNPPISGHQPGSC